MPAPPNSSGTVSPKRPISFICSTTFSGYSSRASISSATGYTSCSTNSRTIFWIWRWSSVSSIRSLTRSPYLVQRVAPEDVRVLRLVGVRELVPSFEARVAVVLVMSGGVLELGDHQVLLHAAGLHGRDLERRQRGAKERAAAVQVLPDG